MTHGRLRDRTAVTLLLSACLALVPLAGTAGAAQPASWTRAASMAAATRQDPTLTRLGDGSVLVTGGRDAGFAPQASAERYDPAADAWSSAGAMSVPRDGQAATLLDDGSVLVTGGETGFFSGYTASAERYDPAENAWSAASSMGTARWEASATRLEDGSVLVAGGLNNGGAVSSAERYDPATGTWSSAGRMSTGRYGQTATLLADGSVLLAGGQTASGYSARAERYDPATNDWSVVPSMGSARAYAAAVRLRGGDVLVTGGYDGSGYVASAERFDPVSGAWSDAGTMGAIRGHHTATLLGDGSVLVAGGISAGGATASAERYDPATGDWSDLPAMSVARATHAAVALRDGRVLVVGGLGAGASAELFTPARDDVDDTPPAVRFTDCPSGDVTLGSAVTVHWVASDAGSGVAGEDAGSLPLATDAVGPQTVTAAATDHAGNRATAACDYRVVYAFGGFAPPIGDGVNAVKAGSAVPVKFTLGGNQGLGVLADGSPFAGDLRFDDGQYRFVWKTSKAWAGTTRTLSLALADGTTHTAEFRFR